MSFTAVISRNQAKKNPKWQAQSMDLPALASSESSKLTANVRGMHTFNLFTLSNSHIPQKSFGNFFIFTDRKDIFVCLYDNFTIEQSELTQIIDFIEANSISTETLLEYRRAAKSIMDIADMKLSLIRDAEDEEVILYMILLAPSLEEVFEKYEIFLDRFLLDRNAREDKIAVSIDRL